MKKLLWLLALPLGVLALAPSEEPLDLLIAGGRVVDGSGAPWFAADVGVRGGKIVAVGALAGRPAKRTIDAKGMLVTPGFIDLLGQSEYNVLVDKRAASKITQGITTEVTGEGASIAPVNDAMLAEAKDIYARYGYTPEFRTIAGFYETLEKRGTAINLGTFVGAGTLRDFVIGKADRRATPEELKRMCDLVDQAMREGALGVSSSLQYVPDMYNSTDELIAMAKVAARYGGAYFTHQRSEGNAIDSSLDEVFRIAKEAPIRSQIWHLKTAYKPNWGKMPAVLARIEAARAEGIDVAANQYPWTAGSNGLDACLPPWIREGGRDALLKRLADPKLREKAKKDMLEETSQWSNQYLGAGGPDRVLIASVVNPKLKSYEGKTVAQMAAEEKKDPRDALIDLVIADRANIACIIFMMDEKDVRHGAREPDRGLLHRLAGRRDRRHLLGGEVPPARLGILRPHPRLLRPRREGPPPRGGSAQDDVVSGGGRRPPGPGPRQGRVRRGPRGRRHGEGQGPGDLRRAARVQLGVPVRRGQRRARRRRRKDHGGGAGQGAARSGVPGAVSHVDRTGIAHRPIRRRARPGRGWHG